MCGESKVHQHNLDLFEEEVKEAATMATLGSRHAKDDLVEAVVVDVLRDGGDHRTGLGHVILNSKDEHGSSA
jgi:hypothetical protein